MCVCVHSELVGEPHNNNIVSVVPAAYLVYIATSHPLVDFVERSGSECLVQYRCGV